MRTQGGYRTRQRDIILELLKKNTDSHLSSEDVCEMLKSTGEKVGATTVYRYLEKLYTEGKVQKYITDRARYTYVDNNCREHFHLKCTECGKVLCADCDFLAGLDLHIGQHHGFKVDTSKTVFYGICSKCSGKAEK